MVKYSIFKCTYQTEKNMFLKYFFSLGKYPLNIIQEMALKLDIFKFLLILYQGISDTRGDSLPMILFLISVFFYSPRLCLE